MKTIPNPYGRGDCFFCGPENPVGLKLTFQETDSEPKELVCRWVPPAVFKGFGQILHGGIQSGIFDEIMGWTALHLTRKVGVTSNLSVNFLKPVLIDQEIEARCRIAVLEDHKVDMVAEIRDTKGSICSTATGTYILMDRDRFNRLVGT